MATFTITENFGTYKGNTSYIIDGNKSNCWQANQRQSQGKYVQLTSDEMIHVNTVEYTTTNSSEIFKSGAYLQTSTDGSNWDEIGGFNGSKTQTFTVDKDCQYIRIYCKSGSGYVSISELDINYQAIAVPEPDPTFLMKTDSGWIEILQVFKKTNGFWIAIEQSALKSDFNSGDYRYVLENGSSSGGGETPSNPNEGSTRPITYAAEPILDVKVYSNGTATQAQKNAAQAKWRLIPPAIRQIMLNQGYEFYLVNTTTHPKITLNGQEADFSGQAAGATLDNKTYVPINNSTETWCVDNAYVHEMAHGLYTSYMKSYGSGSGSFWYEYNNNFLGADKCYNDATNYNDPASSGYYEYGTTENPPFLTTDGGQDTAGSSAYYHHIKEDGEEYFAECFDYIVQGVVPDAKWQSGAPKAYKFINDILDGNIVPKK